MKSIRILSAVSAFALSTGISAAAVTPDVHRLEASAPRTVVVLETATPPVIRAGLLQSTLIMLPAEEKVATVLAAIPSIGCLTAAMWPAASFQSNPSSPRA